MENGDNKGKNETGNVISAEFGRGRQSDTVLHQEIGDRIRNVVDVIHEGLTQPAELAGSNRPERAAKAKVVKLKNARKLTLKTAHNSLKRTPKTKPLTLNDVLTRDDSANLVDSISGGSRSMVHPSSMAEADEDAVKKGYAGVRRIYLMIKNTFKDDGLTPEQRSKPEIRHAQLAERIRNAVQELYDIRALRDGSGEPIFSDNPDDPRMFNAVASILIRVWPHNYSYYLDDNRVRSMVLLLAREELTRKKMIDILVAWENAPVQVQRGKWNR